MTDEQGSILLSIQKALEKIQEHIETIAKYTETQEGKREEELNRVIKSEVGLPIEVTAYYRSEQGERRVKNRRDAIRLYLEIGGLLVAVALVGLTLKTLVVFQSQLTEMQTQTKSADRNFRRDERAWLDPVIENPLKWVNGSTYALQGHINNTGKTPAKNVRIVATTTVLSINDVPEFVYTDGHPFSAMETAVIFPNTPRARFFSQVFDTKTGQALVLTKDLTDQLNSGKYFIVTHGKLTYDDIFAISHWQTFCLLLPYRANNMNQRPPLVMACGNYSGIDNNE
jgi:hypothetical protein